MANRFVDRRPTQPNRYKITQENGAEYYATLERADEPVEVGTPLNAAILNTLYGEDNKPTAAEIGAVTADNNRVDIPEGDDLNADAYLKVGAWRATSVTHATSLTNCPVKIAFTLDIVSGTGFHTEVKSNSGYIIQKITTNDGAEWFRRIYAGSNGRIVDAWEKVYSTKQKPTAIEVGAAPAVADSTYKNCYYRTVDGAKEWLNPPMVEGTEYRTTERFRNMPVYCQLIDCGEFTAGKTITCVDISTNIFIVRFEGHVGFDGEHDYAMQTQDITVGTFDDYDKLQIKISANAETREDTTMMVALYYVKGVPPVD